MTTTTTTMTTILTILESAENAIIDDYFSLFGKKWFFAIICLKLSELYTFARKSANACSRAGSQQIL